MKYTQGLITLAAVIFLSIFACEMPEPKVDMEAEKAAIDSIITATTAAVEAKDRKTMDSLLTEDFIIYQNGESRNLNEFFESLKASSNYDANFTKNEIWLSDDGSLAVYTGMDEFTVTLKGKDWPPTTATMTVVLVKQDGDWRVKHVSRTFPLPKPPKNMEEDMEGKDTMMNEKEAEME